MNINSPYPQNPADINRPSSSTTKKGGFGRKLALILSAAVVLVIIFFGWQISQRARNQVSLIKTANESYAADPRYISFGADYLFAVPKSYSVDETSQAGVQFLIPEGVKAAELDNFDKLFDAAIIAAQPLKDIQANSNKSLKKYVDETLLPDLKKDSAAEITVTYAYVGKYKAATVVVKKEGRQIRQIYAYSGSNPFTVVAQTKSDAFSQVVNTLIGVSNATSKGEIDQIKLAIQSNIEAAQAGKAQELFDGAAAEFKDKSSVKDTASGLADSSSFLKRNIVIPGGTFRADQFVGQLFFPGVEKDEKASLGTIGLLKVDGAWKLGSLTLPKPAAAAPAPAKKK